MCRSSHLTGRVVIGGRTARIANVSPAYEAVKVKPGVESYQCYITQVWNYLFSKRLLRTFE